MDANLATTNMFLGIIAVVSVLEALLVIATGIGMFVVYRRITDMSRRALELMVALDERHVAPAMGRVNAILDDVKDVTATVKQETERVDYAIRSTMDRVDHTAERVRSNMRAKTARIVGLVRGVRTILETLLQSRAA
jgi:hypothetical protein